MPGLTRQDLDAAEAGSLANSSATQRPRDAATLILLKLENGVHKVLVGKRRDDLAFMAGKFVFPGGRRDAQDSFVPVSANLPASDLAKLKFGIGPRATDRRAQALALSAVRETFEEAGLLIGRSGPFQTPIVAWRAFADHQVHPDLSRLRYIARAVTPPGRTRRFDTRFFAAFDDCIAKTLDERPTSELSDLRWLGFAEVRRLDIPLITGIILNELEELLARDPRLTGDNVPVPFHRMRGAHFVRDVI